MFNHPCTLKYQVNIIRKIFREIPDVTFSQPFSTPMVIKKSRTRAEMHHISKECRALIIQEPISEAVNDEGMNDHNTKDCLKT